MKVSKLMTDKNRQYIIFVFMTIYAIFLTLFTLLNHEILIFANDTKSYMTPAKSMIELKGFIEYYDLPEGFRTPGYPLFIALVLLCGGDVYAVVGVQIVIAVLCMYLIYRTCLLMDLSERMSVLCAVLYACDLGMNIYTAFVLSDMFFFYIMVIAVYFLVKYVKRKKLRDFIFFIVFLNYGLMVRPILIYYNAIICVVVLNLCLRKNLPLKAFFVTLLAFGLVFGGWSYRNYCKNGVFEYSTVQNLNAFEYNAVGLRREIEGISRDDALEKMEDDFEKKYPEKTIQNLTEAQKYQLKGDFGRQYIRKNFGAYVKKNIRGIFQIMFGPNKAYIQDIVQNKILYLIIISIYEIYLCAIYATYVLGWLLNYKKANVIDVFIFMYSGYCAVASASVGYARFRVAFLGLLVLGVFLIWKDRDIASILKSLSFLKGGKCNK